MKSKKINLLIVAYKNLGRHRVKTILTILAIVVGVALYIWMDGWLLGINIDSRRNLVNYETGSVKIYSKAYFEKKDELPMYETFKNYDEIIKRLNEAGYHAAPRAIFTGTLLSKDTELPFVFIGIDPEKEIKVLKYYKYTEPPLFIEKKEFEERIISKANYDDKKLLEEVYIFNSEEKKYQLKDIDIENDNVVIKLTSKIKQIEKKREKFQNSKLSFFDKKIEETEKKLRARKRKIKREYLEKISKILRKVEFHNFIKNGSFELLIGSKGASDLNVKPGDSVNCSVTIDKKDEKGRVKQIHQLINFKIAGIVNSPNPKTNGYVAYMPLDILQDDKGIMLEGGITEICIRKKEAKEEALPGKEESPEYIKKVLSHILNENLVVVGWEEDAKDYLAMAAQDFVSTYIMIGILFILAIMGITNTMLMAVFERTKEIGMLRAIGMKDLDIIKLFLYEAALLGLIGSLIGTFIGILFDYWMVYYGIDYTDIFAEANMNDYGYRVTGLFKGAWNIHTIVFTPIVATIVAVLAALFPSLKATKMKIVDALRFE